MIGNGPDTAPKCSFSRPNDAAQRNQD